MVNLIGTYVDNLTFHLVDAQAENSPENIIRLREIVYEIVLGEVEDFIAHNTISADIGQKFLEKIANPRIKEDINVYTETCAAFLQVVPHMRYLLDSRMETLETVFGAHFQQDKKEHKTAIDRKSLLQMEEEVFHTMQLSGKDTTVYLSFLEQQESIGESNDRDDAFSLSEKGKIFYKHFYTLLVNKGFWEAQRTLWELEDALAAQKIGEKTLTTQAHIFYTHLLQLCQNNITTSLLLGVQQELAMSLSGWSHLFKRWSTVYEKELQNAGETEEEKNMYAKQTIARIILLYRIKLALIQSKKNPSGAVGALVHDVRVVEQKELQKLLEASKKFCEPDQLYNKLTVAIGKKQPVQKIKYSFETTFYMLKALRDMGETADALVDPAIQARKEIRKHVAHALAEWKTSVIDELSPISKVLFSGPTEQLSHYLAA